MPPDALGLLQEGGRRRQLRRLRERGIRKLPRPDRKHSVARRRFLHFPDLRRLFGLLRHRHRHRQAVRSEADAQLQRAVFLARHRGVLAAVAHLAHDMVSRLHLHPARRKPRLKSEGGSQHVHNLPRERFLARRRLDVHRMGRISRNAVPALDSARQEQEEHEHRGRREAVALVQGAFPDAADVLPRRHRLDYLPRREHRSGVGVRLRDF